MVPFFVNAALCDVPDVDGDRVSGITTLPVLLGGHDTVRWMIRISVSVSAVIVTLALAGRLPWSLALDGAGLTLLPAVARIANAFGLTRSRYVLAVNGATLWPAVVWMVSPLPG
jgi:4-hydroxybenzoate polyprenyltransferase